MSKRIFTWKDIRRIGKSVFLDKPEGFEQIQAWTSSLLLITTAVKDILRMLEYELTESEKLRAAVSQMIEWSFEELSRAFYLFSKNRWEKIIRDLYEIFVPEELAGGVMILENIPEEEEKNGKE